MTLTQAEVNQFFDYRDGKLFWKEKFARNTKLGIRAGSLRKDGYRSIGIKRKRYKESRLIFLYHHGYLPQEIDHINRNRDDNRIENLREATHSQNQMNKNKRSGGTSKYKGVSFCKDNNKWKAQIKKDGELKYLGYYLTEEKAALAYNKSASKLFGEFANPNIIQDE